VGMKNLGVIALHKLKYEQYQRNRTFDSAAAEAGNTAIISKAAENIIYKQHTHAYIRI